MVGAVHTTIARLASQPAAAAAGGVLRVFAAPEWCSCSCSSTTRTHNVLSLVASRLLQQQHVQHVSSSAAAALAAAQAAPSLAEPCVLSARVPRPAPRSAASGSNVVHYPYSLPALYAPRRCQLQDLQGQPLGAVELPGDVFNVPVRVDILHQVVRWQRAKARQGTHKTKDRSEVSGGGRKPWQQKGSGRARQGSIRAPQWRGGGVVHGPVPRSYAFDLPRKVRRLALKCALSAKANEGRLLLLDSLQPWAPKTRVLASALQPLLDTQAAAAAAASVAAAATAARRGGAQGATRSELGLPQLLLAFERRRAARVATLRRRSGIDAPRYRSMLQAGRLRLRQQTRELEARRRRQGQGRDEAPTLRLPVPLSAVLLDSGKEGLDGGEALRRAAANLPGVDVLPARGANVLSLLRRDYVIMTKPALDELVERLRRPIVRLGAAGRSYQQALSVRRADAAASARAEALLQQAATAAAAAAAASASAAAASSQHQHGVVQQQQQQQQQGEQDAEGDAAAAVAAVAAAAGVTRAAQRLRQAIAAVG